MTEENVIHKVHRHAAELVDSKCDELQQGGFLSVEPCCSVEIVIPFFSVYVVS